MRRSREDTAATRDKILKTAARLFRARGISAVSVADVMSACGLTVGGFYRHFENKDALVSEAIELASVETTTRSRAVAVDNGIDDALDAYLSRAHRDHPGNGCPVAALCSEIAHEAKSTRHTFTAAIRRLVDSLPGEPDERLVAASALVGSLVLARATDDGDLADAILSAARNAQRGRRK
jgi:TetR/AcrR family transcriptional repressor of nem operon